VIPKKLYYSISEVCTELELEPHVLRYWETEFSQLRPKKNRAGNRAYREKDIEVLKYIKHLLYEEKFTIPGAKKKLGETKVSVEQPEEGDALELALPMPDTASSNQQNAPAEPPVISEIKKELREILNYMKSS
jgi:DNA-binding transcriptional MerR regulator